MMSEQTTKQIPPKKCQITFNFTEALDGFEIHLRSGKIMIWGKYDAHNLGTAIMIRTFKEDIIVDELLANVTHIYNFPMETVDYYTKIKWSNNTELY